MGVFAGRRHSANSLALDERRRINRLNLAGVVDHLIFDLVHRRARRIHVAVRRVPDAVLVVEDVIAHAPLRVCPQRLTRCWTHPC